MRAEPSLDRGSQKAGIASGRASLNARVRRISRALRKTIKGSEAAHVA
jgi:hypothetical protein